MKNNNSNSSMKTMHTVLFGVGLGLIFGMTTNIIIKSTKSRKENKLENLVSKTQENRFEYMLHSPETYNINRDKRVLDSLAAANQNLFDKSAEKYFEKIDKKYTMGRFFNASEIAQINKILTPYTADTELASYMPLGASTTIAGFEDIVRATGIAPAKLMPVGVEFDCGYIFRFRDAAKQKLFESYIDAIEAAFMADESPNFEIREIAPIRAEYTANCAKMDSIWKDLCQNDSVRGAKLAEFDKRIDSLQVELNKIQPKSK